MTKLSVGGRKRALVSEAVEEQDTHGINWAIQMKVLAFKIWTLARFVAALDRHSNSSWLKRSR
jgi:hypothetical protein